MLKTMNGDIIGSDGPPLRQLGFYNRQQVCEMTTWSAVTLWRRVKAGDFPQPIRLSPGRVGFPREAVNQWVKEKIEQVA